MVAKFVAIAARYKVFIMAVAALGVATIALFSLISSGPSLAAAAAPSCSVYVAFYDQLTDKKAVFLNPASKSFAKIISPTGRPRKMPHHFIRDTGEVETFKPYSGAEPVEKKIRKRFPADVSGFFEPLWSGNVANIKPCFRKTSSHPGFHKGRYKPLHMREKFLGRADMGLVTVWSVSPVGLSENGDRALLYAEYFCGGSCGGGSFYLFENQGGTWVNIGDQKVWVS